MATKISPAILLRQAKESVMACELLALKSGTGIHPKELVFIAQAVSILAGSTAQSAQRFLSNLEASSATSPAYPPNVPMEPTASHSKEIV